MRRGKGSNEDLYSLYLRGRDNRMLSQDRRRVYENFRRMKAVRARPWSPQAIAYRIRRFFERLFPS